MHYFFTYLPRYEEILLSVGAKKDIAKANLHVLVATEKKLDIHIAESSLAATPVFNHASNAPDKRNPEAVEQLPQIIEVENMVNKPRMSRHEELKKIIKELSNIDDLNTMSRRIQKILDTSGKNILQKHPNIFLGMVKQANSLLESDLYLDIAKKMSILYQPHKAGRESHDGPLQYLVIQIEHEDICQLQEKLFELIRVLLTVDDSILSRSKCLRALIMKSNHISKTDPVIEWTKPFIDILHILLEGGADPTWIPKEFKKLKLHSEYCVLFQFFFGLLPITKFQPDLLGKITELFPRLLLEKYCKNEKQSTALHALLDADENELFEDLESGRSEFFENYKKVISNVIELSPYLVDRQGHRYGYTPLHRCCWLVTLPEDVIESAKDIVLMLKSERNINMQNYKGQTPLHYLIKELPTLTKPISKRRQKVLLSLVKHLRSTKNRELQGRHGETALHILMKMSTKKISRSNKAFLSDIIKSLVTESNLSTKDENGQTPLHILVEAIYKDEKVAVGLNDILPSLITPQSVNITDNSSMTPLNWIQRKKFQIHHQGNSSETEVLSRIEQHFIPFTADHCHADQGFQKFAIQQMAKKLKTAQDLDTYGPQFLDLLGQVGKSIVDENPDVLVGILRSASLLIGSVYCEDVFQKISTLFKMAEGKPQEGLLELLNLDYMAALGVPFTQERFLRVTEILMDIDRSTSGRSKYFNHLLNNMDYISYKQRNLQWSHQVIVIITKLLEQGAEPTFRQQEQFRINESSYEMFHRSIMPILANHSDLLLALEELFPWFLKGEGLYDNILHRLVTWNVNKTVEDLPANFFDLRLSIIQRVIEAKPSLVNTCDKDGWTPLHFVTRDMFVFPTLGPKVSPIVGLLANETNVNAKDNQAVTPYSWILVGKARYEYPGSACQMVFSEIQRILAYSCPDEDDAKAGSVIPVNLWIDTEFKDLTAFTKKGSQRLLDFMKSVPISVWSNAHKGQSSEVLTWLRITNVDHPDILSNLIGIVGLLVNNETTAREIWDAFGHGLGLFNEPQPLDDTGLKILALCAEGGAKPKAKEIKTLASRINAVTKSEKLTVSFLKILLAVQNKHPSICDLSYLEYFYVISKTTVKLGKQLLGSVYPTLDHCLKSMKLINCFLFVSNEDTIHAPLTETWVRMAISENWLLRSPLHLAATFLDNANAWQSLPKSVINKFLDMGDLHGCTPLHVAYLHQNEPAISYLLQHGANESILDKYGETPKSLGTRFQRSLQMDQPNMNSGSNITPDMTEIHPEEKFIQMCSQLINTKSGILETMKPLLILDQDEAQKLSDELKTLFERLIKETTFVSTGILVVGSMREKLKAGCLNEADVQIRFEGYVGEEDVAISGVKYKQSEFFDKLSTGLINGLAKINWDGINLRPICVHGPWTLVREGHSSCKGLEVSVDVVPLIECKHTQSIYARHSKEAHQLQKEILEGAPKHEQKHFTTLHKKDLRVKTFNVTPFESEWDIIDSLPTNCRLAVVIAKTLVQAYDCCKGGDSGVKMPITSYWIKTAMFFIYAYNCTEMEFIQATPAGQEAIESFTNVLRSAEISFGGEKFNKLKYNPNPQWLTDEDVSNYSDESRSWAWKIFSLIKCLASNKMTLNSFWDRLMPFNTIDNPSQAEYILDVCDCMLERLTPAAF